MVQALIFIVLFSSFQLQAVDPRACLLHVLLREEARLGYAGMSYRYEHEEELFWVLHVRLA